MAATTFENHAPINFERAEEVARYWRDGGVYDGIGHSVVRIMKGKLYHVYSSYSSGCDYGSGTHTTRRYLYGCRTREELICWLLEQLGDEDRVRWANGLLADLDYEGEAA